MLRKIRIALALLFFLGITLLLIDYSGVLNPWLGWMAKVQLLPALLAVNVGVVVSLLVVTLLLGRVYCSVICPLGVMQDCVSWLNGARGRKHRHRFAPSRQLVWLRWGVMALFVAALIAGVSWFVALLAPYSSYGRIVVSLLQPLWKGGNNILADIAERNDSYLFATTQIQMSTWPVIAVAVLTFIVVAVLAWRNGRTYCNTICPVGTLLGAVSRLSLLKPVIDTEKCNGCGLCGRSCKASCIDTKAHVIDYSRCVACMDCLEACHKKAISYTYTRRYSQAASVDGSDKGRRAFMIGSALIAGSAVKAHSQKKVDGGFAEILDKKAPQRRTRLVPPGALSLANLERHCTACQLCVSACPSGVLKPSGNLLTFGQPHLSYENGHCRPECTRCSDVCPTGAIVKLTEVEKSSVQIGHAVWIPANCLVMTDDVECGNCQRHCPAGAITMVESQMSPHKVPAVDAERCIGCGACEHLCPARPFSAIYVEGHENHRII